MGSRETDFEEERFVLGVVYNPFDCPVTDIVIRVCIGRKVPGKGTKSFFIIGAFAVLDTFLLLMSVSEQILVPLIQVFSTFEETVFVFHNMAFVESAGSLKRPGVHLANVAAIVTGFV